MPSGNDRTPAANPPPLPSSSPIAQTRSVKTLWIPRGQLVRFLRSFIRGGLTWLTLAYLVGIVAGGLGYRPWGNPVQIAPALVGLGVTICAYRTLGDLKPKPLGPPERSPVQDRVQQKASEYGGAHGCAVGGVAFVLLLAASFQIVAWLPHSIRADPDLADMPTGAALLLAMGLLVWVTSVVSDEYRDAYARQHPRRFLPPDLDLVKNTQRARQALEQAMGQAQQAIEQAANWAEELQDSVAVQQRTLNEIERQTGEIEAAATITKAQAESIALVWDARQERARRRSFWSGLAINVIVGFVFYALGVLTPVLVNTQSLHDLLQR